MMKSDCVGCKTHFQQGSRLPLQGISIELKLYPIPIKDKQHKWKLLKTICSFLNSKGGTIFIGAEDKQGEVRGVQIQRKQQDQFKIFIHQLTDKIKPAVDLSNREDINVQFVPVLSKGKFTGKYVVKIIVNQGEPSQLYCVSKRIQLQSTNQKQKEEYEIVYSFLRINAGCLKQFKGYELVELAKARASKPPNRFVCFHDNCNPDPPNLLVQILKIGFSQIYKKQTRQNLQQWCQIYLKQLKIQDQVVSFDEQNHMIVIEFEKRAEFEKVQGFITKNIEQLNKALLGECQFVKKGNFLDCIVFQNIQSSRKQNTTVNKNEKTSVPEKKPKYIKKQKRVMKEQQSISQEDQQETKDVRINKKKKQQEKKEQGSKFQKKEVNQNQSKSQQEKNGLKINNIQKQNQEKSTSKESVEKIEKKVMKEEKINKRYSFTFTHINPKTRQNLISFVDSLVDCKKVFERYENTVELFLPNQDSQQQCLYKIIQFMEDICNFGFKHQIRFGQNMGIIDICNFDNQKGKPNQLKSFLNNLIGKQATQIQIMKKGSNNFMRISLSKQAACYWLDRLLKEPQLKSFQIPGADKGQRPKIKVYLVVANPLEQN